MPSCALWLIAVVPTTLPPEQFTFHTDIHCGGDDLSIPNYPYGWTPGPGGVEECKPICHESCDCDMFVWYAGNCYWKSGDFAPNQPSSIWDCYVKNSGPWSWILSLVAIRRGGGGFFWRISVCFVEFSCPGDRAWLALRTSYQGVL